MAKRGFVLGGAAISPIHLLRELILLYKTLQSIYFFMLKLMPPRATLSSWSQSVIIMAARSLKS